MCTSRRTSTFFGEKKKGQNKAISVQCHVRRQVTSTWASPGRNQTWLVTKGQISEVGYLLDVVSRWQPSVAFLTSSSGCCFDLTRLIFFTVAKLDDTPVKPILRLESIAWLTRLRFCLVSSQNKTKQNKNQTTKRGQIKWKRQCYQWDCFTAAGLTPRIENYPQTWAGVFVLCDLSSWRRPGVFEVNNIPVHFQPWEEGTSH